jgi:hypothetical protein
LHRRRAADRGDQRLLVELLDHPCSRRTRGLVEQHLSGARLCPTPTTGSAAARAHAAQTAGRTRLPGVDGDLAGFRIAGDGFADDAERQDERAARQRIGRAGVQRIHHQVVDEQHAAASQARQ